VKRRDDTPYLAPSAFARHLGIHAGTVRKWILAGLVASVVTPTGHYLIPRAELDRVVATRVMPPRDRSRPLP